MTISRIKPEATNVRAKCTVKCYKIIWTFITFQIKVFALIGITRLPHYKNPFLLSKFMEA